MEGTGLPVGKTFFLHCQRRHPKLPRIPTYLPPSLGQPGVGVLGERADDSSQVADKGHGFLLHSGGVGGKTSVLVGQGVEVLPLLLHAEGLAGGRPHAEGPLG